MARYPIKDQIAIVGVGSTGYARAVERSAASLAVQACTAAILDAGLTKNDISGVCAAAWNVCPSSSYMQTALGIPDCTWWADHSVPVTLGLSLAMDAVFAGAAETVLVYHSLKRLPTLSRSARHDPFRVRAAPSSRGLALGMVAPPGSVPGLSVGYAGLMSRYMHEFHVPREDFGYLAINASSNAARNPLAARQEPTSMADYLAAPMVHDPMCVMDMDVPVDGADAFVVTTVERARDLRHPPILIHASASGRMDKSAPYDGGLDLDRTGHDVAVQALWERSDLSLEDADIFMAYDGFSIVAMSWLENVGYCARGEGGAFVRQHWDAQQQQVLIGGKVPINPHGGSLAEGASQGAGHLRESVVQLRGAAGSRQVPGAKAALVTAGAFLLNATAQFLRTDS